MSKDVFTVYRSAPRTGPRQYCGYFDTVQSAERVAAEFARRGYAVQVHQAQRCPHCGSIRGHEVVSAFGPAMVEARR